MGWADLHPDVFSIIMNHHSTPFRFKSVCTSWNAMLDAPSFRKSVVLDTQGYDHNDSDQRVSSFALFMCKRAPVTTELLVCAPAARAPLVCAALSPVLFHLRGCLVVLSLDSKSTSTLFPSPVVTSSCLELVSVFAFARESMYLKALTKLRYLDVVVVGNRVRDVQLPTRLTSLRIDVEEGASDRGVSTMLTQLEDLVDLHTFALDAADMHLGICLDDFSPKLRVLVLRGRNVVVQETLGFPALPLGYLEDLETLCLQDCRLVDMTPRSILPRCKKLRVLELRGLSYFSPVESVDVTHLPLKVVVLESYPAAGMSTLILPRGIQCASFGYYDLRLAMVRHHVLCSVTKLSLELGDVSRDRVHGAWPPHKQLPGLKVVQAHHIVDPQVSVVVGQRCPRAHVALLTDDMVDAETEWECLATTGE